MYFKSLTILTTDNRIFSYWHFLPLMDVCISNHWQIYFLALTLTIVSPITNSCTIDNWHFYHLWLYFLPLRILSLMITGTLLKTDNSEQWQLHFLSSTIILLTTDNCTYLLPLPTVILYLWPYYFLHWQFWLQTIALYYQ